MNKQHARQYVHRLVVGLLEEHFSVSAKPPFLLQAEHPLVYDELCEQSLRGRRLSRSDHMRITEALGALFEGLERGDGREQLQQDAHKTSYKSVPWTKADGKPGSKWKGYEQWAKRQGR